MAERIEYALRFARRDDNAALCALTEAAPMQSDVTVAADRSPDFFAFYDLHGEMLDGPEAARPDRPAYLCAVAEHDGHVVGTVAAAMRQVRLHSRTLWLLYPMDARVDPAYQHRGVFSAAWGYLRQALSTLPFDAMRGFILRGNTRAHAATEKVFAGLVLHQVVDVHLVHFSMYWPYSERGAPAIDRATDADRDRVTELLTATYGAHHFAPLIDRRWLDDQLSRSPGYDMQAMRIVRDGGDIVALLGLWDQSSVRRLLVRRNPPLVRAGILAARMLHRFVKSPPPPRAGQPLNALYLKHVACRPGHEEDLRRLMRSTLNSVRRQQGHNLVWGAFSERDPHLPLWRGFAAHRSRSVMYYSPVNPALDIPVEALRDAPAYADFSMV